jgi:HEPN domain-containing protein
LTYQNVRFPKTHNLSVLLESCIAYNQTFSSFYEVTETLTPYATEFRYPSDVIEPEREEAEQAIAMANTVVKFVMEIMPSS